MGLQFEEEDERAEELGVFEEEMRLVDLFEEKEVDDMDERGFAEVVTVLVGVFGFGDCGEDDAEPLVRHAVEPYGCEPCRVVGVDS